MYSRGIYTVFFSIRLFVKHRSCHHAKHRSNITSISLQYHSQHCSYRLARRHAKASAYNSFFAPMIFYCYTWNIYRKMQFLVFILQFIRGEYGCFAFHDRIGQTIVSARPFQICRLSMLRDYLFLFMQLIQQIMRFLFFLYSRSFLHTLLLFFLFLPLDFLISFVW